MRCYLITEGEADVSSLLSLLDSLGVETVTPERGVAAFLRPKSLPWLPDVDFLCVVFPGRLDRPTPPAIYVDIGVAVGSELPVFIIVEPPRVADSVLSPLHVAQVSLHNTSALSFQINHFLGTLGHEIPAPAEQHRIDTSALAGFRHELATLDEFTAQRSGSYLPYREYEDFILCLLESAGTLATGAERNHDHGFDIAAWVPGTETVLSGPILINIKILMRPRLDRSDFNGLQLAAISRNAPIGLLLYHSLRPDPVLQPQGTWPLVTSMEINDLLTLLEQKSLAQVVLNARNAMVHGRPPQ